MVYIYREQERKEYVKKIQNVFCKHCGNIQETRDGTKSMICNVCKRRVQIKNFNLYVYNRERDD